MGGGLRIFKEKMRETLPGGGSDATSNSRTKSMMKAVVDFSLQVKKCEKAIRAAQAVNSDLLGTTQTVMTMPLPQTFEDTNGGAGSATAAMNLVGGPYFRADTVSQMGNETGHKLETDVLAPLVRWQEVHTQLAARFKVLEDTRREMDSRRRTVTDMANKVSTMRAKMGASANAGSKAAQQLDTLIGTLSHKEAKLQVTTQNFEEQEALLARDLVTLILECQHLKYYVRSALQLQGGALLGVAGSFGELTTAPAPALAAPPAAVTAVPI